MYVYVLANVIADIIIILEIVEMRNLGLDGSIG